MKTTTSAREERRDTLLFALSILSMLLSIMVPFGLLAGVLTWHASIDWMVILELSQGMVAMNPWFLVVPVCGAALLVIWKIQTPRQNERKV